MLGRFVSVLCLCCVLSLPGVLSWYDAGWTYRINITLNTSQIAGTHTDFPLLVRLNSSDLSTYAQSDGDDIVFTYTNNTKMAHEIERYHNNTGELVAWVRVANLTNATNTTLHLYFGNSSVSNQQNRTGVWSSSYLGVWHFHNGTTLNASDSTSNANNGFVTGVTAAEGIANGAGNFTDDTININNGMAITNHGTVCAWIKPTDWAETFKSVFKKNGNYIMRYDDYKTPCCNDRFAFFYWNNADISYLDTAKPTVNEWSYVCGVVESNAIKAFYVNGVVVDSTPSIYTTTSRDTTQNLSIGAQPSTAEDFSGLIDEPRIQTTNRSTNWILTEFNNQKHNSTMLSFSAKESTGNVSSTCTYGGTGNWNVLLNDQCNITSSVHVQGILNLTGSGAFRIQSGGSVNATDLWFTPTTLNNANILAVLSGGRLLIRP